MRRILGSHGAGFVTGLLVALGLVAAFGAGYAAAPVSPHYSVNYGGTVLLVTDNQTNQLYVYENAEDGSKLRSTVDLSGTGKLLLKGVMAGDEPAVESAQ